MAETSTTTYMNLVLPTPGERLGPTWATDLNTALTRIDQHDHSSIGRSLGVSALTIDGDLDFSVPVGGGRGDVYNAFPDYYDSRYSGWNQTVNYKNMADGPHTVEVRAYTEFGGYASKTVNFCVTRFISEFISDPEEIKLWETKRFHIWHDRIVFEGVMIEGRRWNMELSWSTATQAFEITATTVYRLIDEYTTYECDIKE